MRDHSSDDAEAPAWPNRNPQQPRRSPGADWRRVSTDAPGWRTATLGVSLVTFGVAVAAAAAAVAVLPRAIGPGLATAVLWLGMLVPVAIAFGRARPPGLFRLRPVDLLYGVTLGLALRIVQGWVSAASTEPFPSYPLVGGALRPDWWFADLVAPVLIAPTLEEFFFRGIVLVCVYRMVCPRWGQIAAVVVALAVSTGLFVLAHGFSPLPAGDALALTLVGVVCGLLVVLTGRIWAAVLVHAVFNLSFVALALAGTWT